MSQTISEPRPDLKPHAPRIEMAYNSKGTDRSFDWSGRKSNSGDTTCYRCNIIVEEVEAMAMLISSVRMLR